jgi:hypothetical protein
VDTVDIEQLSEERVVDTGQSQGVDTVDTRQLSGKRMVDIGQPPGVDTMGYYMKKPRRYHGEWSA